MAKEIGNLYYTIGVKGERDAKATLARVQDAISKSKKIDAVSGISMAKPSEGASASAAKDARAIAAREAKRLGFELGTIVRDVRAITKAELAALHAKGQTNVRGAFSPSQKVIAVNKSATERTVKHELIHAIDAAIGGGKLASTIQGHLHNRLAKAFAPVRFKEIIESESFAKMDQKRKNAYLKYSMLPQELFVNLMERQSDEFKRAVFGTGIGKLTKRPTGKILRNRRFSDELRRISDGIAAQRERKADERFLYKKNHYATDSNPNPLSRFGPLPYSQQLTHDEREQLRQERLAARRAQRGALSVRLQQGMGLPIGTIGGSQSVFGVGAKPQLSPYVAPPPVIPPQMHGPDLPPPLPMPWLYRVNDRMSLRGHRGLSDRAGRASALSDEITNQVLDHRINTELAAARAEVRAAQADQRVASRAGDPVAMQAANQRLNAAQNDLLNTEERRRFVASEHSDIIRDVNAYLRTQVTLEEKIASAEQAAVNYARQRNQNMTAAEEETVRQRVRQGIVNRTAHGGTTAAKYEQERDSLYTKAAEQREYIRSAAGQNDPVAREYARALNRAHAIRRVQARNETRMAEIREGSGGNAPSSFDFSREAREYRSLERANNRLNREMERYNQVLHGIGNASKRWNYQLLELGYGVQDFTQVLAGGGGLSAALRGASNNLSQFFAAGGGKNAALWATGIGVGALAIGMLLDNVANQAKEAAERLSEVLETAGKLTKLSVQGTSGIFSSDVSQVGSSFSGHSDVASRLGMASFTREAIANAMKERTDNTGFIGHASNFMSDAGTAIAGGFRGMFHGRGAAEMLSDRRAMGYHAMTSDMNESDQAMLDRLNKKWNKSGTYKSDQAKAIFHAEDNIQAAQIHARTGSKLSPELTKLAQEQMEAEEQAAREAFVRSIQVSRYKSGTKGVGALFNEERMKEYYAIEDQRIGNENRISYMQQRYAEATSDPQREQYVDQIEKLKEENKLLVERRQAIKGFIQESSGSMSGTFDAIASASAEFSAQRSEHTSRGSFKGQTENYLKARLMKSMEDAARSFSPTQMLGESVADFSKRIDEQVAALQNQLTTVGVNAKVDVDPLIDQINILGQSAKAAAEAMENFDRNIAFLAGTAESETVIGHLKSNIKIEADLEKQIADINTKYRASDPKLAGDLIQEAKEDANRKARKNFVGMIRDEFRDKVPLAGEIASAIGGRKGAQLSAEMDYERRIADIEASGGTDAQKDAAIGVAKDLREAELEKIDRKNVSFTDVGSMWKTIQGSLQNDNKKILNHWKTYMDLVKGEGIRVKLGLQP